MVIEPGERAGRDLLGGWEFIKRRLYKPWVILQRVLFPQWASHQRCSRSRWDMVWTSLLYLLSFLILQGKRLAQLRGHEQHRWGWSLLMVISLPEASTQILASKYCGIISLVVSTAGPHNHFLPQELEFLILFYFLKFKSIGKNLITVNKKESYQTSCHFPNEWADYT